MRRYHFSISQEYLSSFEVWEVGFQKLVKRRRKGGVHVSVRTSPRKGGALGPEKGKGKELGYRGASPGEGKRLHTLQQAQGSPAAGWLGAPEVLVEGPGAQVQWGTFSSLQVGTVREVYCLPKMLMGKKNPAFLHPGVWAI